MQDKLLPCWYNFFMVARTEKPKYRFILGVILLAALTLYSCWRSIQYYDIGIIIHQYEKFGNFSNDNVSRVESKLSCLKGELSKTELVGFVSPLEGRDRRSAYRWTQYAMAPIIVVDGMESGKMIAYYPGEDDLLKVQSDGYSIIVDCENGVGLVAKGGKN